MESGKTTYCRSKSAKINQNIQPRRQIYEEGYDDHHIHMQKHAYSSVTEKSSGYVNAATPTLTLYAPT